MVILKTSKEIDAMRKSNRIVGYVLSNLYRTIKPGITTNFLNEMAEDLCFQKGGTPGFKGYRGFPYSVCSSRNEEVVHGFPSNDPLEEGEILSIDFGVLYKGWYGDAAFTKSVGTVDDEKQKLIDSTEKCLYDGIAAAQPWNRLGDIGYAIQRRSEINGYCAIRNFVGHGIGRELHELPQVLNYGRPNEGLLLKPGTVIAIEPMLVTGSNEVETLSDNWTAVTKDRGLSAHWEHTIAITEKGPEILTKWEK